MVASSHHLETPSSYDHLSGEAREHDRRLEKEYDKRTNERSSLLALRVQELKLPFSSLENQQNQPAEASSSRRQALRFSWNMLMDPSSLFARDEIRSERVLKGQVISSCPTFPTPRPFVRWWWLDGSFDQEEIERQLDWVKDQSFGGVEIAWIRPLWLKPRWMKEPEGALKWLTEEFAERVGFAKRTAESRGLGCDVTFGSCWPFGDSFLSGENISQNFEGASHQRITSGWTAKPCPVLNHLSREALKNYCQHLFPALKSAIQGSPSAIFCDSLEIEKDRLWDPSLWKVFEELQGFSLKERLNDIDKDPHLHYEVRKLVGQTMLKEFFEAFTEEAHKMGTSTRVQCHGAPTDLLSAYAAVDIPESETLLFPPHFSRIPASAALLKGLPVVSCETFTCMYGFPGAYLEEEQLADLKLLADSVFANGVNQIVWHGMPFNPKGHQKRFYATVHVGPDSAFADGLKAFNSYLETVSGWMRVGKTKSGLAVYLPNEDMMMKGVIPRKERTPGAYDYWEMRDVQVPKETEGFLPTWISLNFLKQAKGVNGQLVYEDVSLPALYIDVEWLDSEALDEMIRLANEGVKMIFKSTPKKPGLLLDADYEKKMEILKTQPNVYPSLENAEVSPILSGEDLPPCWAREHDGDLYMFFAHPETKNVSYPMDYGQAANAQALTRSFSIQTPEGPAEITLHFKQGESLLIRMGKDGKFDVLDLEYQAPPPITKL